MNSFAGPAGKFRFCGEDSILTWRAVASVHSRNKTKDHAPCSVLDVLLDQLPVLSRLISSNIE